MKLVEVSYEQCRLEFFEEQLAAAKRKLDWAVKHNPDCYAVAEKGEAVAFFEWAAEKAQQEVVADTNDGCKWIPVTERLPEKMCQCVCRYVFGENTEYPFFQVLWYFKNLEEPHFQHEGNMGLTVTHWMPLPEPPKEVE